MIINQQIIIITITRNLSIVDRTIIFPPLPGRQIFVTFVREKVTKLFNVEIEGEKIFVET